MAKEFVIGIDIGGTNTKFGIVDRNGNILQQGRIRTDAHENAEDFIPERFLAPNEAIRKYYHPFGAGPRMCIGNHFALMEITLILAKMVHNFDFKLVPNQKIEAQPMITLKPKYGIQLMKL